MPLDGDRFFLANLAAISIQGFANTLANKSDVPIRGLRRLVEDVKNGRRLGDSVDKFYSNVLRSVSAIKTDDCPDIGERISKSLELSIGKMRRYFSMIVTDDPIYYHSKHLIAPDTEALVRFGTDVTSSFMRIAQLMQLDNKALSLPALKDQYNLAFENAYKPLRITLFKLMRDGSTNKDILNERIEDILCLEWYSIEKDKVKSDIRVIRNLFAHPDRIDRYDHYSINLKDGELKLYADDLMTLNDLLINKLMLVTFLANVILDLEMYHRVFEV